MQVKTLESFVPNVNLFLQDAYHMGTKIGENCIIMFEKFDNEIQKYIIVINPITGERIKITF